MRSYLIACVIIVFFSCSMAFCADINASPPALRLGEVIEYCLSHHPALSAYYHSFQASQEVYGASGLQPNPELILSAVNGDAPEESNSLSQRLQLFGKPHWRKKAALGTMRQQEFRYQRECRDLTASLACSYIDALEGRHLRQVEEENVKLADHFARIARKRYETGDIPYLPVLDSSIEYAKARNDLEASRLVEKNSLVSLFRLSGLYQKSAPDDGIVLEEIYAPPPGSLPSREALRALALERRPELNEALWSIEQWSAERNLAYSEGSPDIILQAYRGRLFTESGEGVRASLVIPLFDWGSISGQAKAAGRKEEAARTRLQDMRIQVMSETDEAYNDVQNLATRLDIINSSVIGDQERMVDLLHRGYVAGLNSYLEVLEGRRSLRTVRKDYYELMARLMKALVRLERATGVTFITKEKTLHEKS